MPNRLRDCRIPDAADTPLDANMARMTRVGGRYVRVVYVGGACTLRALQRALGRARFDDFMRRLVATHRDGVDTTAEFVAAIRAAAPGRPDGAAPADAHRPRALTPAGRRARRPGGCACRG